MADDIVSIGMKVDSRDVERAWKNLDQLAKTSAIAGAAITAAFAGVSASVFNMGRQFDAINSKMRVAGADMEFVRELANELGLELTSTADSFAGFAAAAKDTALEGEGAEKVYRGVATAARALGLDAQTTEGAMLALQQMVSKGVVSAEELRGQLGERLPGAFNLAAEAMGMTTAELGKALQRGELMAEDLLPKLADAMENRFGDAAANMAQSGEAAFNRLINTFTDTRKAIGDTGAYSAQVAALNELNAIIGENQEGFDEFAKTISDTLVTGMQAATVGGVVLAKSITGVSAAANILSASLIKAAAEGFDTFLAGLENLYDALEELPGEVGDNYAAAKESIQQFRAETAAISQAATEDIDNLASNYSTSAAEIEEAGQRIFTAIELGNKAITQPETAETGSGERTSPVEKITEENQKKLDAMSDYFLQLSEMSALAGLTEEEAAIMRFQNELERIEEQKQILLDMGWSDLEAEAEIKQAREDAEAIHWENIKNIRQSAMTESSKFTMAIMEGDIQGTLQGFQKMTAGLAAHNRAAFEANKAFATASVIVDGVMAVQKAASAYPFPFNVPGVAFETLRAVGNLAAVRSASFGGGGNIPTSQGGSAGGVPSQQVQQQTAPAAQTLEQQRSQTVVYVNGVISQDQLVNEIVPMALQDKVINEDFQIIPARSRNAQEILDGNA